MENTKTRGEEMNDIFWFGVFIGEYVTLIMVEVAFIINMIKYGRLTRS